MRFPCRLTKLPSGSWLIRHQSAELRDVSATAGTRTEAIDKMRGELRYRLELCPCTGESYQHIDIQIVEEPSAGHATR